MHKKINEEKTLIFCSAALILIISFSLSFFLVLIDRGFYDNSFSKYGAYDKIGVEGVRATTDSLIKYLTSEYPDQEVKQGISVFTEKEKSHLADVRRIILFLKYTAIISLVAIIVIFLRMRIKGGIGEKVEKTAFYAAIANSAVLAIILLLSINFTWLFANFHKIFFPQGNWIFPDDSLLITMFPREFFQDFLKKTLFHAGILTVILYFLGTSSNFFEKKKKTK